MRSHKKGELVIESMTIYFLKPVQMESVIEIKPNILEAGRKFGKMDRSFSPGCSRRQSDDDGSADGKKLRDAASVPLFAYAFSRSFSFASKGT